MDKRNRILGWILCVVVVPGTMIAGLGSTRVHAQTAPAAKAQAASAAPISDEDLATTQDQLLQLLRTSPKLTTVVARDPSLLSNQEYVNRNNPQLAQQHSAQNRLCFGSRRKEKALKLLRSFPSTRAPYPARTASQQDPQGPLIVAFLDRSQD